MNCFTINYNNYLRYLIFKITPTIISFQDVIDLLLKEKIVETRFLWTIDLLSTISGVCFIESTALKSQNFLNILNSKVVSSFSSEEIDLISLYLSKDNGEPFFYDIFCELEKRSYLITEGKLSFDIIEDLEKHLMIKDIIE